MKRKVSEKDEQQAKRKKLPEKEERVLPLDKETSAIKGAKVDAFFYPKTETQRKDQQVCMFFKETLPRLQAHLNVLSEKKKGIKWNLMYNCTLSNLTPP